MDRLVRRLFQIAESEHFTQERQVAERAAVLAVGGYARREMSLHSDVDLLLLHEGAVTPYVERLAERIQLWLWDAGLTVGWGARTGADEVGRAGAVRAPRWPTRASPLAPTTPSSPASSTRASSPATRSSSTSSPTRSAAS